MLGKKISELKASNAEKDKHIATLEVELKQAKEEYEAGTSKIRRASADASIDLSAAQVKIGDLNDEINHTRQRTKNYQILMTNCYTLGNRCCNEFAKNLLLCCSKVLGEKLCGWRIRRNDEVDN